MTEQVNFEELEHRATEAEKRAKLAKKEIVNTVSQLFRLALDVLSKRTFLFLSLLATVGLFAWAMVEESVLRTVTATIFLLFGFLPALWILKRELDDAR